MDLYDKIKYVCSKNENCESGCPFDTKKGCVFLIGFPIAWPDSKKVEVLVDEWIQRYWFKEIGQEKSYE